MLRPSQKKEYEPVIADCLEQCLTTMCDRSLSAESHRYKVIAGTARLLRYMRAKDWEQFHAEVTYLCDRSHDAIWPDEIKSIDDLAGMVNDD